MSLIILALIIIVAFASGVLVAKYFGKYIFGEWDKK